MSHWSLAALAVCVGLVGCKKAPPKADAGFSDALVGTLVSMDGDLDVLAEQMRGLEEQAKSDMDLQSSNVKDRSLTQSRLTEDDIADLPQPEATNVADALPVTVAGVSSFSPEQQLQVQLLADMTPVEPYSPDYYDREFTEGRDCWPDRSCEYMRTQNTLTKDNFLMTIDYQFIKDFRWVDLNQAPPGSSERIAPEERWAYIGRAINEESFTGRNDKATIKQSYSVEVWIPRDNGGTLHLLALWAETIFNGINFTDDQVAATTRAGIDKNFRAAEDWLEQQ